MVGLIYLCSENSATVIRLPESKENEIQPGTQEVLPRRWKRLSPGDRARVVERYEAGEMSTDLAGEFGVAKSTILAILREANVVVRRQSPTPQQVADAATLCESGRSLSQVAASMSLKQDTIRLALKAAGVKVRPPTGG